MKKILTLIVIIGIVIVMILTVPDKKAHKEAMMKAVKELVDEEAEEKGLADNGLTRLGKGILNKAIEGALGAKLHVDNYYLFNTTHVKMKEGNKLLSVGMFGQVFTFNKQMLRDALDESAEAKREAKEEKKRQKEERKRLKKEQKEQRKMEKQSQKENK